MPEIVLLGDIAFTGIISSGPERNNERFAEIIPHLCKPELSVFANLEVPVKTLEERNEYKKHIHFADPEVTSNLLKLFNISCVSLANNHIFDCKMSGLKATINLLDNLGILHTGAGWKAEQCAPVIMNSNNFKTGFIAYVDKSTNPATEHFKDLLINVFDIEIVKRDINELKHKVDKIICSIHWGTDYSYYPTPDQITVAKELVDTGADIIMGHHPHTFQPFEKYKNGYIFYSLGTVTFGDYIREGKSELQALFRKTKKSAIVNFDLVNERVKFQAIKELKGNNIILHSRDYQKWSERKWIYFKIKNHNRLTALIYIFNEKVLYRIYEYFFGYYKNPIKRLIQFSNLKKIKKLF